MQKLKFKNEYGRDIEVRVERVIERGGLRPGHRIKISIAGPDSTDTNIITPREARVVAALIERELQQKP